MLLGSFVDSINQGICVVDRNLDLVMLNKAAQDLLELPAELLNAAADLAGIVRFQAMRGDFGPGDPEELVRQQMAMTKTPVAHDFVLQRGDGRLVQVQSMPVASGGFVAIYTDVTHERRRQQKLCDARAQPGALPHETEQELRASRDLLFNAIDAISDGLGLANPQGQVILANQKLREIYPEVDKLIAQRAPVAEVIRSVFPDEPDRNVGGMLADGAMWTERLFPNGKWYKVTRTRSSDGGLISAYSDVTKYKEQQRVLQEHANELVRLLRQEKQLTETQREFVSMASHEFRTPLAIIDSNAQRLKRKVDELKPEMVVDRVDRIREAVDRMQYLISRFLSFSQAQSVGMELQIEPAPFRKLVGDTCCRQQSVSKKHAIHMDIGGLPDVLEIDQKLIEQSVTNILSNAVKYSPGKADIYVLGRSEGEYAVLSVRDEGVGIPADEIPKVFNRYFRASTSSGIAGTGIGLNMTEMIIQKHRGRVEIESAVGEGTTVTLYLPLRARRSGSRTEDGGPETMKRAS